MPVQINISADIKKITQNLSALVQKQIPYATAVAVNNIAKRVKDLEKNVIKTTFPTATPFTLNSVYQTFAKKGNPTATIDLRPIAAQYLSPFEIGGKHDLGTKKGLLTPILQPVNQYGNLPQRTMASLTSRSDIFIGPVKRKGGMINGVWQRTTDTSRVSILEKRRGRYAKARLRKANETGGLKLLIKFSDPLEVRQQLYWHRTAQRRIKIWWRREFDAAMKQALASAR
jgi:hypothetical protein